MPSQRVFMKEDFCPPFSAKKLLKEIPNIGLTAREIQYLARKYNIPNSEITVQPIFPKRGPYPI